MNQVGFTGTRQGMTHAQRVAIGATLANWARGGFHHGDCVGADADAHELAFALGYRIVLHPPADPRLRAFCNASEERAPLPYLERNRAIVDETQVLIATPAEVGEPFFRKAGGTWHTVRYARQLGRPILIIFPDGSHRVENWTPAPVPR